MSCLLPSTLSLVVFLFLHTTRKSIFALFFPLPSVLSSLISFTDTPNRRSIAYAKGIIVTNPIIQFNNQNEGTKQNVCPFIFNISSIHYHETWIPKLKKNQS